jgi:hypothetical protein
MTVGMSRVDPPSAGRRISVGLSYLHDQDRLGDTDRERFDETDKTKRTFRRFIIEWVLLLA